MDVCRFAQPVHFVAPHKGWRLPWGIVRHRTANMSDPRCRIEIPRNDSRHIGEFEQHIVDILEPMGYQHCNFKSNLSDAGPFPTTLTVDVSDSILIGGLMATWVILPERMVDGQFRHYRMWGNVQCVGLWRHHPLGTSPAPPSVEHTAWGLIWTLTNAFGTPESTDSNDFFASRRPTESWWPRSEAEVRSKVLRGAIVPHSPTVAVPETTTPTAASPLCPLCCTNPMNMVCAPCMHWCTCTACAAQLEQCPFCRCELESVMLRDDVPSGVTVFNVA